MYSLTLNLSPLFQLTEAQFEELALVNQDVRLERTARGDLTIMPPTGGETGKRNLDLEGQLWLWNRQHDLGIAFNSSTGFRLPNGAIRSPDAAWITKAKWNSLDNAQRKKFLPLCPDFVIELVSESDELEDIQLKMQEYMSNGLRLGWLINPKTQIVEIYRFNQAVEILDPSSLFGEDILPGFILDLQMIW